MTRMCMGCMCMLVHVLPLWTVPCNDNEKEFASIWRPCSACCLHAASACTSLASRQVDPPIACACPLSLGMAVQLHSHVHAMAMHARGHGCARAAGVH
eukprot:350460-Chlamydomonas_euryale.AAC.6